MKFVTRIRVSTERQGRSGLGLEAQKAAIAMHVAETAAHIVADFVEVESGRKNERPQLVKALHMAKVTGSVLLIAKLDRLSRNAAFLLNLQEAGVPFTAADMPNANELTVGIMALIAQQESKAISQRTKAALQAAKERGQKLGNPNGAAALRRASKGCAAALEARRNKADEKARELASVIADVVEAGHRSLNAIAAELNKRGIQTPSGNGSWYASSVRNLQRRIATI